MERVNVVYLSNELISISVFNYECNVHMCTENAKMFAVSDTKIYLLINDCLCLSGANIMHMRGRNKQINCQRWNIICHVIPNRRGSLTIGFS